VGLADVMAADPGVALAARDISISYPRGGAAVSHVTADFARGAHTVILGPSGSGKSSLLRVLAGAQDPTSGHVETSGRIARIHQDLRLVPQLSAMANVLHGALGRLGFAQSLRFPVAERERAESLLKRVGLGHRLNAAVRTLSGGEAQRVAIARALMQDPDILLADEPVAALDPATADDLMALLDSLRRERGLTLVTVLHDHDLAARYADRVITLDHGRIFKDSAQPERPTSRPAQAAVSAPVQGALLPERPIGVWALLASAVLIALSWGVMRATPGQAEDALATAIAFLGQLVPTAEELRSLEWGPLLTSLLDTLRMSVIGTAASVLIALPLSALAARNVAPRFIGAPVRWLLNLWRSVPSIIWALLFVAAVGLGTIAGVLGLIAYSLGYLTKFFYEAFEGVDAGAPSALGEIGANGPQRFWHAVWPMSGPAILAACLFMLEYNVRAASVLGLVGAGGIGQDLKLAVEWSNWHVVGVILVLFGVTVLIVDAASSWLRRQIK
jgi:phosphonate transport system permease protein